MLSRTLDKPRTAVKVELVGGRGKKKTYKVLPGIHIVKPPLTMVERPDALIIDDEGNPLSPEGIFLWSAETIDPYHLVVDLWSED